MSGPCSADDRRAGCTLDEEGRAGSLRLPLVRLLQLVMILQRGRFPNAQRLADACAVSRRTIYRDLASLEAAGITVAYRADRQGYQLVGEGFLAPSQLDDQEALALLLLSRLCPPEHAFGLLEPIRSGVEKVIQALPGEVRARVILGGELIAGATPALDRPTDRQAIYASIWRALRQRRQMRLWYHGDSPDGPLTTKVSLYRLARIDGCWSVVGRSTWHREIHLFRIPWIHRVELTDDTYTIPPRFHLERWLTRSGRCEPADAPCEVKLRFAARIAPLVHDAHQRIGLTVRPLASGAIDVVLKVPIRDEVVDWILGFGDQVEVLQPERLRRSVRDRAERIARNHAGTAP